MVCLLYENATVAELLKNGIKSKHISSELIHLNYDTVQLECETRIQM